MGALSPVHVPGRGDMPVPCRAGRTFRKVPSGRWSCPLTLLESCCGVVLTEAASTPGAAAGGGWGFPGCVLCVSLPGPRPAICRVLCTFRARWRFDNSLTLFFFVIAES